MNPSHLGWSEPKAPEIPSSVRATMRTALRGTFRKYTSARRAAIRKCMVELSREIKSWLLASPRPRYCAFLEPIILFREGTDIVSANGIGQDRGAVYLRVMEHEVGRVEDIPFMKISPEYAVQMATALATALCDRRQNRAALPQGTA